MFCGLALAAMSIFAAIQLHSLDMPWLRRGELALLDLALRVRGTQPPGPAIVLVMIDDRSVDLLGSWPVPRERLADAVTILAEARAKVIGIDVLFSDYAAHAPAAPIAADAALARAIERAGNVVVPFTFRFDGARTRVPGDSRRAHAYAKVRKGDGYRGCRSRRATWCCRLRVPRVPRRWGHMLLAFDVDGSPRYDYPVIEFDLDYYPSMAVRIAQRYLDVPWDEVRVDLGRGVAIGDRSSCPPTATCACS